MNTGGPASEKTLADEFAGQALAGLVSESGRYDSAGAASDAYNFASAMLAEKARREAVVQESSTTDHSPDAGKMAELEKAYSDAVDKLDRAEKRGHDWSRRLHSMIQQRDQLLAANRELVEALELLMSDDATEGCDEYRKEKARAILAKHKGAA